MRYDPITGDEMKMLVAFVEDGNRDVLGTDAPSKLSALFFAFQKRLSETNSELRRENARLHKRLSFLEARRENDAVEGNFGDLNLDSVDVARAVLALCSLKGYEMTWPKLMAMVFDTYAVWLVSHHQRLFLEAPKAQESGPWFWRVAKNVNTFRGWQNTDVIDRLASVNPGVVAVIRNVVDKYGALSEKTVCDWLRRSPVYRESHKDNNQGKWNKEMADSSIYAWKAAEMGR